MIAFIAKLGKLGPSALKFLKKSLGLAENATLSDIAKLAKSNPGKAAAIVGTFLSNGYTVADIAGAFDEAGIDITSVLTVHNKNAELVMGDGEQVDKDKLSANLSIYKSVKDKQKRVDRLMDRFGCSSVSDLHELIEDIQTIEPEDFLLVEGI